MNKWKPGDTPCFMCETDWHNEDHNKIEDWMIGTYTYPECGDGCCWNRDACPECNGTGIDVGGLCTGGDL
ncbi:hypothetical protein D3C85_293250 [compost metagenome]